MLFSAWAPLFCRLMKISTHDPHFLVYPPVTSGDLSSRDSVERRWSPQYPIPTALGQTFAAFARKFFTSRLCLETHPLHSTMYSSGLPFSQLLPLTAGLTLCARRGCFFRAYSSRLSDFLLASSKEPCSAGSSHESWRFDHANSSTTASRSRHSPLN